MLETNTKNWEKEVFDKGIAKGIQQTHIQIVEKMVENGKSNADIRKVTGLSLKRISAIKKRIKK